MQLLFENIFYPSLHIETLYYSSFLNKDLIPFHRFLKAFLTIESYGAGMNIPIKIPIIIPVVILILLMNMCVYSYLVNASFQNYLVVPRGLEPLISANQADAFPITPRNHKIW